MAESPLALLVALRFVHVAAAAVWVGGGALMLAARVAPRRLAPDVPPPAAFGRAMGRLLGTSVGVFAVTGAILAFDRLSEQSIDAVYVSVLAVKVAVAFVMFWLARPRARSSQAAGRTSWFRSRMAWAVGLGAVVYVLSLVLNELAEAAFKRMG